MNDVVRIGRYRVDAQLGAGGFAEVWRGFDEGLDDEVAIKVLFEHLSRDTGLARRFLEEARLLRRLASDRIVRVYDVDTLQNGQPYFVMEHAELGTLEARMRAKAAAGQRYSVVEALAISAEMAECLTVVHDFNVVHRDIKPSNVLHTGISVHEQKDELRRGRPARTERMVLGDFGIAHRLDLTLTHGMILGTPLYMAPEMADLSGTVPVDRRADVYSAAIVLYELLTGRTPFTPTWNGVLFVPRGKGPPPSLRATRPDVPPGLEAAMERALSMDPAARFSTAWEWGEVLQHWLLELRDDRPRPGITVRVAALAPSVNTTDSVLLRDLVDLCDSALASVPPLPPALAGRLSATRGRLTGPVRIAVVADSAAQASTVAAVLRPLGNPRRDAAGHDAVVIEAPIPEASALATGPERRELLGAHVFVVVLPVDVARGGALLRSLRRLVRDRVGLVNCVGVALVEPEKGYRIDPQLRSMLSHVYIAPPSMDGDLGDLRGALQEVVVVRGDMLKAMAGFRDLSADLATGSSADVERLDDELERLRIEAHDVDELEVLAEENAGLVDLPETLSADLRRVLGERDLLVRVGLPPDARLELVKDAAARGAARWRSFVNGGRASDRAERAAHVVALSYERLWAEAVRVGGERAGPPRDSHDRRPTAGD